MGQQALSGYVSILTVSGLVLFSVNYITGWLLKFGVIKMTKRQHQVIYILLLANVLLLLAGLNFLSNKFLLYLLSFLLLVSLPLGKKGGVYHIIISTLAVFTYLFTMLNYQFFRFFD